MVHYQCPYAQSISYTAGVRKKRHQPSRDREDTFSEGGWPMKRVLTNEDICKFGHGCLPYHTYHRRSHKKKNKYKPLHCCTLKADRDTGREFYPGRGGCILKGGEYKCTLAPCFRCTLKNLERSKLFRSTPLRRTS